MVTKWQGRDAKARFSEFLEASLVDGPQIATKRGVETSVLLAIDKWRRLEEVRKPDLKDLLLTSKKR